MISLARGVPAPECIPVEELADCARSAIERDGATVLSYGPVGGYQPLREWIAERHGVEPSRILVTNGSLQGLAFLADRFAGGRVLVEQPTYDRPLKLLAARGVEVTAVPMDDDGLDVDALADALDSGPKPAFLYTIPTFQNPTGRTMSAARRAAVAEAAAAAGLWIVEDDPYGELRYDGEPVPWIASLPGAGDRTVLLGSFSKVMAPGLRLGWLRAPAELRRACAVAKQAADLHTPTLNQLAAARYLDVLDAHVARVRAVYGERRDAMLAGLPSALPPGSQWSRPEGGMFLWVRLPEPYDTLALLPRVVEQNVAYVPGAPFYAGTPDPTTLRLCFVTQTPEEIAEGLRRLGRGLQS